MNLQIIFAAGPMPWIVFFVFLCVSSSAQERTQSATEKRGVPPLGTEIRLIETAEAKRVVKTGFLPSRQPEVYWHGTDWNIDLVIPSSEENPYSVSVRSSCGNARTLELPESYAQVDSISAAPGDKAIVVGECGGTCNAFAVIDLKRGKVIDDIAVENSFMSPDRHFILYDNGYTPHSDDNENLYHLYDTLKSPRENTCGFRDNDPQHKDLDDTLRGFQVYPQKPGQILCTDDENESLDDNMATNFIWAEDSSKIVFADAKSGVMSLVLVSMPVGTKDLPKTSVYALTGAEDVCAGSTDATGEKNCDYHVIQTLEWEGDAVRAVFHHQFGTNLDLQMTIPVSKFIPIGR